MKPLCFVIMPFGKKKDADGRYIDFNEIYELLIRPAIKAAGMESVRADEETVNGIIHKPMYERLILCDYAIADLTTANANVFYELGIRHAVKPYTTVTIFASGSTLPFDLNAVRCMPYGYDKKKKLTDTTNNIASLTKRLMNAKEQPATDSPVYQLIDGIAFQNSVAHQKTDIFRDQVEYSKKMKDLLQRTRESKAGEDKKVKTLDEIVQKQINVEDEEAGVLIDIMLTYRALGAYNKMIAFIDSLPTHVKNTVMVQEQLGFALNRIGEREQAIHVLETVLNQNGPSSETYGILGRVYKDKYDEALKGKNEKLGMAFLDKAIDTYQKGFEADWRDAYPGVNVLTLLEIKGDKEKIKILAPVVVYAVGRKIQAKTPDYWDYASLMEIAVITNDEAKVQENWTKALACPIEGNWMFNTTMKNLNLVADARKKRREKSTIVQKMIRELQLQIK